MAGEVDEEAVATKAELLYPPMRITGLARPVAPDPAKYQPWAIARRRLSRDHIRSLTRTRTPKAERGRTLRAIPCFLRGNLSLIASDSLIYGPEINSLTPHAVRLQHCLGFGSGRFHRKRVILGPCPLLDHPALN